ncbi:MAG: hypothetical protein KF764_28050 [Labilithrix sp.]|nr:hypothetical protein [Labilithrix sp.]
MRKLPRGAFALLAAALSVLGVFAGCGSEAVEIGPGTTDDAGGGDDSASDGAGQDDDGSKAIDGAIKDSGASDVSINDAAACKIVGQTCAGSGDCCSANCDAPSSTCAPPLTVCKAPGEQCVAPNECCTGSCVNGACSNKQCVPDKPTAGACGQPGDCCSGICTNGTCGSVNGGQSCRTAGNPCANANECCSNLCNNGICSGAVSFCTQQGEVCSTNFECCTGNCVKAGGNVTGTCGAPLGMGASQCRPSGTVCGVSADGGATDPGQCESSCCSRSCGPFGGLNGFRVCQPASGCRPTGEVCRADSDCCGWSGSPEPKNGPVQCSKPSSTVEFGRCNNGTACREPGSVCKVGGSESCSAENNCCETIGQPAGNCNNTPSNCCAKDALGIPRCLVKYVGDCSMPPPAGSVCATSADCCGNPCVNNQCGAPGSCIPKGGVCTTSADCCVGIPCVQAPGSAKGVCGGTLLPDGGVSDAGTDAGGGNLPDGGTCALYGQTCTESGDCCSGVPCTGGRCRYP